jgi:predicted HTH domain antitoxin
VIDAYRSEAISLAEAGQILDVPAARVAKVEEKLWRP